jgi:hypothetical protein
VTPPTVPKLVRPVKERSQEEILAFIDAAIGEEWQRMEPSMRYLADREFREAACLLVSTSSRSSNWMQVALLPEINAFLSEVPNRGDEPREKGLQAFSLWLETAVVARN